MHQKLSEHAMRQWLRIFVLIAILSTVIDAFRLYTQYNAATRGSRANLAMGLFSKPITAQEYDYIIVGGGTAGCVLANRLSAYESKKVLVLEAGSPKFEKKYMKIPAGIIRLFKTKFDWDFQSEKEKTTNNREIYLCRGKVLGGSSSLNVLLYHRGNMEDYDAWATSSGSDEWGPRNVLPYFKKSQDDYRGESRFHGTNGEYSVSEVRYQNVLSKAYLDACQEHNYVENRDFNDWSRSQEGYGRYQVNEKDGARCSTATGFLKPVLKRKNLKVQTEALVTRIIFDQEKKATGVEVELKDGQRQVVSLTSGGEVLLAGGAIQSPQVLMLSGVGPAEHLLQHNIPVVLDHPGVGKQLQDQPAAVVSYSVKSPQYDRISPTSQLRIPGTKIMNPAVFAQWLLFRKGILTSVGCDHGGFFKTDAALSSPDLQMRFLAAKAISPDGMATFAKFRDSVGNNDGFSFQSIAARPYSRGEVQLRSADPKDKPMIHTGYFSDERDLHTMREGIKLSRKLAQASAFREYIGEEVYPGPAVQTDAEIEDYIRSTVHTSNALVGTCRMGTDKDSVVGADLKVHGLSNVRVIDASVMPKIPGGQTGAPTVMIAEKGADFVLGHVF
jgi:choline dehydrogenase-like flavoprotein